MMQVTGAQVVASLIWVFHILSLVSLLSNGEIVLWQRENGSLESNPFEYCETPGCRPLQFYAYHNGDWTGQVHSISLTPEECETENDIASLVCPKAGYYVPCNLYTAWGTRVSSCADITSEESTFMVPESRPFAIPTKGIGYKSEILHLPLPTGSPFVMETLSEEPRVFRLRHFFTVEEAKQLINLAEDNLIEVGNSRGERAVDTFYDLSTDLAVSIKKRAFDLLGIYPFDEKLIEGLHISHFRPKQGSPPRLDWIEPSSNSFGHNYNSAADGTNRYVTFMMTLSAAEEGGETVFPLLEPHDTKKGDHKVAERLKHPYDEEEGSENDLAAECDSRLTVKLMSLETLVVYSQKPNGVPNYLSLHGRCPVIKGDLWVASFQIWNGAKAGLAEVDASNSLFSVSASFESKDVVAAKLYWEDMVWEELLPHRPIKVNTFAGHKWNVKIENELVATWVIQPTKRNQRFILRSDDLPVIHY